MASALTSRLCKHVISSKSSDYSVLKMNSKVYKWCAVPQCKNTTIKTPNKVFVHVPNKKIIRDKWFKLARRDPNDVATNSPIYFCEDHFDLPNDMENYMQYHVMGSVSQVRMNPGCMPKKFECQSDIRTQTCDTTERPYIAKKQTIIPQECQKQIIFIEQSSSEEIASSSESTNHIEIEVEANIPDVETINTQALEVTLARIRANPQLYIGIPKNCYHLIDIIHKQTEIPTTHILLCLKKIKLDTHIEELADQFGITADEASDIFISNVPALANILHTFVDNDLQIPLLSEHSLCVIDSLEINVQSSSENSSELTQTERGNIVKYVVCCTPDGYINYVSPGYGGRQSDDRLLKDTNYLDRLKSGDSVMPNGLRNVEPMMLQRGLNVVKPLAKQKDTASLRTTQNSTNNESQMSEDQLERLVQRIREFTMVRDRSVLSCDLVRVLDEAVVISCALINLQSYVIN